MRMMRSSNPPTSSILPPLLWAVVLALWAGGCADRDDEETPVSEPEFRIVCLSPALTDILIHLGVESAIVGRDQYERQLAEDVPRVGDLLNLNLEAILKLRPSDLVLQAANHDLPPRLIEIAEERGWNIVNLQIDGLTDLRQAIEGLPESLTFAGEPDLRDRARMEAKSAIAELETALAPLDNAGLWGRAIALFEVDPIWCYGPGSYVTEALAAMGVENALAQGPAWQELPAETLMSLNPETLIVIREGAEGQVRHEFRADDLGPLIRLPLQAIENKRVIVVEHPQALLPGASQAEVFALLRRGLEHRP